MDRATETKDAGMLCVVRRHSESSEYEAVNTHRESFLQALAMRVRPFHLAADAAAPA